MVPSELFDEMEALYAPPDHSVFELVPAAFHEHVCEAYSAIGEPDINMETFWEVYLHLRQKLNEPHHQSITEVLTTYRDQEDSVDIPLLPNLKQFRQGQPLDLGSKGSYIGGLELEAFSDDIRGQAVDYADFSTDDEDETGDDEDRRSNRN